MVRGLFTAFHANDRMLRLVAEFDAIDWTVAWSPTEVATHIGDTEILLLNNVLCTPEMGEALRSKPSPRLGWIHFISAGVEKGLLMGLPDGVPVSSAAGTNGPVLAEHAMTLVLACMRRFGDMQRAQQAKEWRRLELYERMRSLEGARICIVGLGAVGREVARKLRAFDAEIIAVSRSGKDDDPNVSRTYSRVQLHEALRLADVVIICTNSDASSYHLIDAAAFSTMKSGSYLINVARGEIVDELALIDAIRERRIAGAGLDVTEVEPLPADSPLWSMDEIIVSPHVAGGGSGEGSYQRQRKLFAENFRRWLAGEPLCNPVM